MNWFGHLPPPIWTSGSQFQDCLYCNSQGITGGYPSLQSYYGVSGMGMGFGGFGEGGMHGMHGMHGMPGIHGAHGMPGMPGMAMGGMMSMGMPVMGHPGMGVPAFYTSKTSEDKDDEDTDPFDYDWYGNPVGFATEKRHLRWHLAHSINQTNLLVDPQTHASIQALLDSGDKDKVNAVVNALKRYLACGGVWAYRVLQLLQHLSAGQMVGMLDSLKSLAKPSEWQWNMGDPQSIVAAMKYRDMAAKAKSDDEAESWNVFTAVVGKPRVTWPEPPAAIGWTFAEQFPIWDGKTLPEGWEAVLLQTSMLRARGF